MLSLSKKCYYYGKKYLASKNNVSMVFKYALVLYQQNKKIPLIDVDDKLHNIVL